LLDYECLIMMVESGLDHRRYYSSYHFAKWFHVNYSKIIQTRNDTDQAKRSLQQLYFTVQ